MALAQPAFVNIEAGQDLDVVVSVAGNTTGWTIRATVRTSEKSVTAVITKTTTGGGITNSPGTTSTLTVHFLAADTTSLTPGAYTWEIERTDSGTVFPIVDTSGFRITSADGSAYPSMTNLSEFIAYAGLSESISDADAKTYLLMLGAAEEAIRGWCGRNFNYGSYVEYPKCFYQPAVQLRETPARSTAIDVRLDFNRTFGTDTQLTYGTDCLFEIGPSGYSDSGLLYRIGTVWNGTALRPLNCLAFKPIPAIGVLKVTYSGGYELIPDDLRMAVWMLVADRMGSRSQGRGLQSESGMNYSYSVEPFDEEAKSLLSVQQVIFKYRRGDLWVG